MYEIQIDKKTIKIPSDFSDVSYETFLKYIKCTSDLQRLELFSEVSLAGIKATEREMSGVISLLSDFEQSVNEFIQGDRTTAETHRIEVLGKQLKFDKNLGRLAYWPLTEVKEIIKKMGDEPFNSYEHYGVLVGHYLYSKYDVYDEQKANDFTEDVVMQLPFDKVIQLGDFFLYIQRLYWTKKVNFSNPTLARMKSKLALKFLKTMGSLTS